MGSEYIIICIDVFKIHIRLLSDLFLRVKMHKESVKLAYLPTNDQSCKSASYNEQGVNGFQ